MGSQLIILDTNVLISRLPWLKALVNQLLASPDVGTTLIVPGIVIQELDGLRNSQRTNNAKRSDGTTSVVQVAALARQANDWLLPIINRVACVRGQKSTESPRGNWMYNRSGVRGPLLPIGAPADPTRTAQMENDDLILECAIYFARAHNLQPGMDSFPQ